MVIRGYTAKLVAATLAISRSSLYYHKKPRGSRADRTHDEQIVVACGEKLAYGYRPRGVVAATEGGPDSESQAGVTGDARTRVAGALAASPSSSQERMGPRGSEPTKPNLAVGHDEDLGWVSGGLGLSGERDRLLYAGDRGLESLQSLPNRRCSDSGGAGRAGRAAARRT